MAIQKQRQFGFMRIINCWYFEHINMRHNFSQKTFEKLEECLFYLHVNPITKGGGTAVFCV